MFSNEWFIGQIKNNSWFNFYNLFLFTSSWPKTDVSEPKVPNPILKDKDHFLAKPPNSSKRQDSFRKYTPTSLTSIKGLPLEDKSRNSTPFIWPTTYRKCQEEPYKKKLYTNKIYNWRKRCIFWSKKWPSYMGAWTSSNQRSQRPTVPLM